MIKYHKDNNLLRNSNNNLLKEFFSSFLTILYSKSRDLKAVSECIYILEREGFIKVKNDIVTRIKPIPFVPDAFMNKANIYETMKTIGRLSIGSFVEDLITYA